MEVIDMMFLMREIIFTRGNPRTPGRCPGRVVKMWTSGHFLTQLTESRYKQNCENNIVRGRGRRAV